MAPAARLALLFCITFIKSGTNPFFLGSGTCMFNEIGRDVDPSGVYPSLSGGNNQLSRSASNIQQVTPLFNIPSFQNFLWPLRSTTLREA